MSKNKSLFNLIEISKWPQDNFVELPKVQRGFVWKPNQIEDLWDSMVRKYPIGSFVFNIDKNKNIQLLDGQQRATAITLGFDNKTFRSNEKKIKIFIDLELPEDDSRKYYFRVITDSQPWGYQLKPNNKSLDADQKRDALKYWEEVDLINPDLNKCLPYDATLPVPLSFFLEAKDIEEATESILNWDQWENAKGMLKAYLEYNESTLDRESQAYQLYNDQIYLQNRISNIYKAIKQMLNSYEIPALYLDNALEFNNSNQSNKLKNNELNNTGEHEVENLFIRLNSGGTPLRGEELNYSILKSKINLETQKKIENACEHFIAPARFITVAFRLFTNVNKNQTNRDTLNLNINARQFQASLDKKGELKRFERYINDLIENKTYNGKNLIEFSKSLLEYNLLDNTIGFPHLVVLKFVNNSPELLFMLWYRLVIKQDYLNSSPLVHKRVLGLYSMFFWLGKGNNNRDHSKLLRNVWPAMKVLNTMTFWSEATVNRAMLNDALLPIPLFTKNTAKALGIKWFLGQNPNLKTSLLDKLYKEGDTTYNTAFNIDKLFFNTDLVLYAQRNFLYKIFKQKQFHLDDTNVPFDWDHIYPKSLIEKKRNPPRRLKEIYNSIGNFRAWPYELNRMDNANTPKKKLNPEFDSSQPKELKLSWQRFIDNNPDLISEISELNEKLASWSFCKEEWKNSEIGDIKGGDINEIYKLIVNRGIDVIGEWYEKLQIEELIPSKSNQKGSIISNAFKANKLKANPSWIKLKAHKEEWDYKEMDNLIFSRTIKCNGSSLTIYFTHGKYFEDQLKESEIYFGFYDKEKSNVLESLKVTDSSIFDLNKKEHYLQGYFTLVSDNDASIIQLFSDIVTWINDKQFPLKKQKEEIKQILADAAKAKFQSCFE